MSTAAQRKRRQRERDRQYEPLRLRCEQVLELVAEGAVDFYAAIEFCFHCAAGVEEQQYVGEAA